MSDGVLRRLDFYVAFEPTPARTRRVTKFAKAFAPSKPKGNTLVAGHLLAEEASAPVKLWFHLDAIREDAAGEHRKAAPPRAKKARGSGVALLFMHIQVSPIPSTPPPARVEERRREGVTAESLFDLIQQLAEGDDVLVNVDARLRFTLLKRSHPILAPPVILDGRMLSLAGAEYRGTHSWEPGLHTLRWSETAQHSDVFASYGYPWQEDALDLHGRWKKEEAQCLSYIGKVL